MILLNLLSNLSTLMRSFHTTCGFTSWLQWRKGGASVTSQYLLGNRARIDCLTFVCAFFLLMAVI